MYLVLGLGTDSWVKNKRGRLVNKGSRNLSLGTWPPMCVCLESSPVVGNSAIRSELDWSREWSSYGGSWRALDQYKSLARDPKGEMVGASRGNKVTITSGPVGKMRR